MPGLGKTGSESQCRNVSECPLTLECKTQVCECWVVSVWWDYGIPCVGVGEASVCVCVSFCVCMLIISAMTKPKPN